MPTLPFPPSSIEQAVEGASTRYFRRVDIYESDGTTLWLRDVPTISGSVTADQTRDERRSASVVLHNQNDALKQDRDGGLWYDKIVKIFMGIEDDTTYWETSIGVFLIDKFATSADGYRVTMSLRDKTKKLKFPLPYTISFPANTPVENIVRDLAAEANIGPSERNLPLSGVSTDIEVTFDRDKERWAAMKEIAQAHGFELWFDRDGVLQMEEYADPATDQPQYVFQTGALSNLAKLDRTASDSLIRNHMVVYGEQAAAGTSEQVAIWGEAFNVSGDSPTNVARLGLRTETYRSEWITSYEQAENLARHLLRYKSLEQFDCNLETLVIPWLEPGVTVEVYDPQANVGDPVRYLLSRFTIGLDLAPIAAVVKRITNVIELSSIYPDPALYPSTATYPGAGTGRVIWLERVKRAWAAFDLIVGAATWFPERGGYNLTIVSPTSNVTTAFTTAGHEYGIFPNDSYLSTAVIGFRYVVTTDGAGNLTITQTPFTSATGSVQWIVGVFESNTEITGQDLTDLTYWYQNEKRKTPLLG